MASLFTKIIYREIPCHKICEDENYFAFLDIKPINPGHTLVVPKREIDYLFELNDELLSGILVFGKKLVPALEKVVQCQRVGIMVAGMEVPHAHLHLIPTMSQGDLTFERAKIASQTELAVLAGKIRNALNIVSK